MSFVIRVKPVAGRIVPQPEKGYAPMPAEGTTIALDAYYSSSLRFGDIEEVVEEKVVEAFAPLPLFDKPPEVKPALVKTPSKAISPETSK